MNAHTPFDANQDWTNPYCQNSSNDPMVDALLGNAYHVVRTVYCNLGNLKLIYDFLNQYGMVLGVQSEAELKALTTKAKYARIYGFSRAGDRQVTDYLYVEGDRTGIIPNDTTATGSWITVATSGSNSGGTSSGEGAYIPWVYANGSATGGETSINVPDGTVGVPFIIINGDMQYVGRGFEFNIDSWSVTLAQPLEEGDEVVFLLTGVPAVPDNPNVNDWVQINWLYNNGAAVGGEQVITIPYTFQSIPAVYKNGLRLYKGLTTESYTADPDNQRILLTEPLATNDRLIVQIGGEAQVLEASDHTLQEVARATNVKDSEVILSTDATQLLNGKKIIYSVSEQKAYGLPVLPTNIYIQSVANGQLTYMPGGIVVDLPPVPNSADTFITELESDNGYKLIGGLGYRYVDVVADMGDDFDDGCIIIAKYGHTSGDLAGGQFTYHSNRNLTPDGGIVINVGTVGQVVRYGLKRNIFPTPVSVQWYGAIPHSDAYDNAIAINAALASPYTTEVSIDEYYLVKTSVTMQSNKALVGRSPSWAYADSGFNMVGTIALSDNHTLGYLDPIVDCRYKRQTTLINIDIDGKGHDVTCLEYGRRLDDVADTQSYNNHVRMGCSLRAGRIGLRTDNAGLHKSFGEQITGCIEAGIYSANNLSDSTFISLYVNEIGYHSGDDPSDLSAIVGVGIHLGPHSGVAFIGGKIEYTRIHIQCSGASYTRFSNMWLDVAKRAAVVFKGIPEGSGRNNFMDNCIITGGGYTDAANGAAVIVDGEFGPMSLTITGGNITAADENINPDATTAPTFGAKLAGVKVGNNPNGLVVINGTDMRKCSLNFTVYAYGNSRVIDNSISNLPNSISGGSTVNGYAYDAGNGFRGYTLREAADDPTAASSGIPVGGYYLKDGNHVCIRKA